MPRKYNCKHPERGLSNYARRLEKRGLKRTPEMESLSALQKKQAPKAKSSGYPEWSEYE
jgi:hypothetical protein